jgi:hypothetical protein
VRARPAFRRRKRLGCLADFDHTKSHKITSSRRRRACRGDPASFEHSDLSSPDKLGHDSLQVGCFNLTGSVPKHKLPANMDRLRACQIFINFSVFDRDRGNSARLSIVGGRVPIAFDPARTTSALVVRNAPSRRWVGLRRVTQSPKKSGPASAAGPSRGGSRRSSMPVNERRLVRFPYHAIALRYRGVTKSGASEIGALDQSIAEQGLKRVVGACCFIEPAQFAMSGETIHI